MGGVACACGVGHINGNAGLGCEVDLGESSEFVFSPCDVSIEQGIFLLAVLSVGLVMQGLAHGFAF